MDLASFRTVHISSHFFQDILVKAEFICCYVHLFAPTYFLLSVNSLMWYVLEVQSSFWMKNTKFLVSKIINN